MARFMYQHFGDDVPRKIEDEYNKMLRHEKFNVLFHVVLR
jgi:hypothetical protein